MPSPEHQAIVDLFRQRPTLIAALLPRTAGIALPEDLLLKVGQSTFSAIASTDFHADLFAQPAGNVPPEIPNVVVEVQLGVDSDKLSSWPLYQAMGWRETNRLTAVLVVTPYLEIATWAGRFIQTGPGKSGCDVFVAGPHEIPRVVDQEEARRQPELAVLSVLAHGGEPDALEVAKSGLTGLDSGGLSAELGQIVYDQIWSRLNPALHRALEAFMNQQAYEFKSDHVKGLLARGEKTGLANAILVALRERQVRVSAGQQEAIQSCQDLDQLNRWFKRSLSVNSARERFDS